MFVHASLVLVVIVGAFLTAKKFRVSTELAMFLAAVAGGGFHGVVNGDLSSLVRHLVEGTFTYFDVCLIFITATFFMALVKETGGVAFIVRRIVGTFAERKFLCLLLLTLVMLIPGALTGSGAASVLTVGALVGSVLAAMGVEETRRVAIIFLCAAMSAAAPPINLWAMMAAAGANMPYVGFATPLAILSVTGALFSMFWLAGGTKALDRDTALRALPEAPEGMTWGRVLLPFGLLALLVVAGRVFPFQMPVLGLPLIFTLCALVTVVLSPRRLPLGRIASETIQSLLPLVGIMVVVGSLIQVMAWSGARGLISLSVVTLPLTVLFATLFLILPISEGMLQYAVAPLIGVPLIMLFNMKGLDPVVALSAMAVMWPLGDCLPPTAVVGRAAVMELGYQGDYYRQFVKSCLVPMAFISALGTLFLIYSKQIADVLGG